MCVHLHLFLRPCLSRGTQSKECQKAHWKKGHKTACLLHKTARSSAARYSGDPNAWSYLAAWVAFHDTTLVNTVVACFLKNDHIPDIHAQCFLFVYLLYRNDLSLPIERRFEVRGAQMTGYTEHLVGGVVFDGREEAVEIGRKEQGAEYWGTAAYFLSVHFGEKEEMVVPYWKYFAIDKTRANAWPTCRPPIELMKHNIHEGLKLRFCCGGEENMSACCCGGWTHEKVCLHVLHYLCMRRLTWVCCASLIPHRRRTGDSLMFA